MICTLCHSAAIPFFYDENYDRRYHQCQNCKSVLLDKEDYITPEEEKNRYKAHNNDVDDPGYQKFVQPVVDKVTSLFNLNSRGLDYGSGPGPVITKMLREQGYSINTFDPHFDNCPEVLELTYDFIVCCEVIEHFHHPDQEFKRLNNMLNADGILICKTDPYTDDIDFENWYYKNDETHVIFYHPESFNWIKNHFNYRKVSGEKRVILFTG